MPAPIIQVTFGNIVAEALVDTDADVSIVERFLIKAAGGFVDDSPESRIRMASFSGETAQADG